MAYPKLLKKSINTIGLENQSKNALLFYQNTKLKKKLQIYLKQGEKWSNSISIKDLKANSLKYFESLRIKKAFYGQYRYVPHINKPNLYASCYAALLRHLYGDLENLSKKEKSEWMQYLLAHQSKDGLFRDPFLDSPNATKYNSWGWKHLTVHVLSALSCLRTVSNKKIEFLNDFYDDDYFVRWLNTREWEADPAEVSNEIQNVGVFLQYARDFQGDTKADHALNILYNYLDMKLVSRYGLWGHKFDEKRSRSISVITSFHYWLLYLYDKREVKYIENAIDNILKTQNSLGGFGVLFNSNGCEDIDSIFPLVKFSRLTQYRSNNIKKALEKALPWVLANYNEDGSAVFRRVHDFECYHPQMKEVNEKGSAYPTWWRSLSLAYLGKVLHHKNVGQYDWNFKKIPGYQFWIE